MLAVVAFTSLGSVAVAAPIQGRPAAGKAIYDHSCALCHGRKGEGLGNQSALPNFGDRQAMARRTDQELFDKITNGGQGTGMPAWSKLLSEQERWDVLAYIRTLAASH